MSTFKTWQIPKSRDGTLDLLWHFLSAYPKRTAGVVILLTVAGFAEGVSVLALLPLLQDAFAGGAAATGVVGQSMDRVLACMGVSPSVGSLLLIIIAGIILKAAVTLAAMKEAGYAASHLMTDLRHRLITAVLAARWSYFVGRPLGLFANAICAETIRAGVTYQQAARFAATLVQAVVYAGVTFAVSWKLALLAVLAGSAGAVVFRKLVTVAQHSGAQQTEIMKSLAVRTTDILQGIKAIKAMGGERSVVPLLDREIGALDEAQNRQVWSGEVLRVAQEPVLAVLLAAGIFVAIRYGDMPLPVLMVLALLFYRLFNRFQAMQEIFQQIALGASAYWSVYRLCKDAEERSEHALGVAHVTAAVPTIELIKVSFYYGERRILNDLDLRIAPGEFVAVSGPSGVGKTTLLDIMSGLIPPTFGVVRVDGRDHREIDLASWRARIGYVPQEMLLLHDTVYNNVTLGDETISRAEVEEALRVAGVWEFVADLPEGLNTMVGERGGRFSGGQRQRISLARALARRPSVLLLDEVTASLDRDTEQAVCATLRQLAGKKMTIIAVSHHDAIIKIADRVVALDYGKVHADIQSVEPVGTLNAD